MDPYKEGHHHSNNNNNNSTGGNEEQQEDDSKPAATLEESSRNESIEEDDDWSRQVETDETTAGHLLHEDSFRLTESVIVEDETTTANASAVTTTAPPPRPRELTLKEKLVMRERERRIETERARLKRQFALSNSNNGNDMVADNAEPEHGTRRVHDGGDDRGEANSHDHGDLLDATNDTQVPSAPPRHGTTSRTSESETLGEESIVAHPPDDDEEEESAGERRLGFNMERFLRISDSFNPQLEPTSENEQDGKDEGSASNVLLKRFLSEPVAVQSPDHDRENATAVARSVSFEGDGLAVVSSAPATRASSTDEITVPQITSLQEGEQSSAREGLADSTAMSVGEDASASIEAITSVAVEADADDIARDPLSRIASIDTGSDIASSSTANAPEEPRVLRLTEADMQEMAAIEEASIGNAPPSEREEEMLSEIGELADFGGSQRNMPGNFSLDTPTTAMESVSQVSGNQSSAVPQSEDHDHASSEHPSLDGLAAPTLSSELVFSPENGTAPAMPHREGQGGDPGDDNENHRGNDVAEGVETTPVEPAREADTDAEQSPRNTIDEASTGSTPRRNTGARAPLVVEGFDFDKHAPTSPLPVDNDESYRDLPADEWSPPGKMRVSPLDSRRAVAPTRAVGSYGAIGGVDSCPALPLIPMDPEEEKGMDSLEETQPLLSDVPPEIITRRTKSDEQPAATKSTAARNDSTLPATVRMALEHAFSEVRSEDASETIAINHESEVYLKSSVLARAFPERLFALTVTLLFELPVLLMISGGSDSLCALIGRTRYQLLIAFLPLTSAISGNVGLQASTLTTRAISHNHVTSSSYVPWFKAELGAASCLALGMGVTLGSLAYVASGMDFAFGLTIFVAQVISIVTAGFTGTMAPLLFSFIFKQDSGKWGGPLETAIQDIVGSFAMVVVSYRILLWVGPGPIDPSDVCSIGDTKDLG